MKHYLYYLFILIICLISFNLTAQEGSCSFKLQEAESLYETGVLDSIPSMLRSCINNEGFDNEELSRAYKLLILTYQFEDYQEMAELTMLKFLKEFPEYELKVTDPIEFKYLYNSYQTIPTFSIGFIAGGNYSMARIIEPYSMINTDNYAGEYKSGTSWHAGVQLKKYINDKIDVNLDIIYTNKTFEYSISQVNYTTTYNENLSILSLPLSGTYEFKMGNLNPYARLGVNLDYLFTATADFVKQNDIVTTDVIKESGYDIIDDRNPINVSALIGGGVKFNVKMGYVMADLRYQYSLMNLVNGDNRYSDFKLGSYNYIDDDFTLNNICLSVGWVYSFYRTKQSKKDK